MKRFLLLLMLSGVAINSAAQDIELKTQFNGHYDYTAFGNTLNLEENESATDCEILTESSANLNLNSNQNIEAAYLYWAGSGPGDFNVELNGQPISAEETFNYQLDSYRQFFAAFADVTAIVTNAGAGNYTLSELDLTNNIGTYYCSTGTNFGGWSVIVVYEDQSLPLNQVGIYDGLQAVSIENTSVTINLDNLNVIDNQGAKIGFLAWEGDEELAVEESLIINGDVISNPPLNPVDNAFNGTNSFTNSSALYNMDLDFYDIEDNIEPGDQSATIVLNSGDGVVSSDFVMVNNIVTVLNSQLPEPEPEIDNVVTTCDSDSVYIDYTINNYNSTAPLQAGNPIQFFADNNLIGTTSTTGEIPIDGTESNQIAFALPPATPDNFQLQIRVNFLNNGDLAVNEINPENNTAEQQASIDDLSLKNPLQDLSQCDDASNDGKAIFDLNVNAALAQGEQTNTEVAFFRSQEDAENQVEPITNPDSFENEETPQVIYLRLSVPGNDNCVIIASFTIDVFYQPHKPAAPDMIRCQPAAFNQPVAFNLENQSSPIHESQPQSLVTYYSSESDAIDDQNPISDTENFEATGNPEIIWVRVSNENNALCYAINSFKLKVKTAEVKALDSIQHCDKGDNRASFDLNQVDSQINLSLTQQKDGFYTSLDDAAKSRQKILNTGDFQNDENPQRLFLRVTSEEDCATYYSFLIGVENCPPFIPDGFSPNGDGVNDRFFISGLYDIFPDFDLKIFSRYGNIVYEGDNDVKAWDGTANHGLTGKGSQLPSGTYYYVLNLHDPNFSIYKGWVYLQR